MYILDGHHITAETDIVYLSLILLLIRTSQRMIISSLLPILSLNNLSQDCQAYFFSPHVYITT